MNGFWGQFMIASASMSCELANLSVADRTPQLAEGLTAQQSLAAHCTMCVAEKWASCQHCGTATE